MPTLGVPNRSLVLLLLLILRVPAVFTKLEVWFGSGPICKSSPERCHLYDLRFLQFDVRGDGNKCLGGKKARCQQKPLDVELKTTPSNGIVIVSYNVLELSFTLTHNGQSERTCHIPRALLNKFPETDVVVLNGLHIGGCLQSGQGSKKISIVDLLLNYGFVQSAPIQGEQSRSKSDGGTVIVSRWPIVDIKEMVFTNSAGSDRYNEKGAIFAKVLKHGVRYNIVGTHLQENDEDRNVRLLQAKEVLKFIQDMELPMTEPVIIAGDFNSDRKGQRNQTEALVSEMRAAMPVIIGDVTSTVDYSMNEMVDPRLTTKKWLDYIVYSTLHRSPSLATLEAYDLKSDTSIRFCSSAKLQPYYVSPDAIFCREVSTTKDLSSHFPVIGRFTFNKDS